MLWPREAGQFIASKSKDVKINDEGVKKIAVMIADAVKEGKMNLEGFKQASVGGGQQRDKNYTTKHQQGYRTKNKRKFRTQKFKTLNDVLPLNRGLTTEQLADWIFLIDALNFNFWTPNGQPKFSVTYEGKKLSGYMAMVSAVNRAIDEGRKMYDPHYYTKLTLEDIKHIFRSDTTSQMPLFDERVRVLKEVGEKLIQKFNGSFVNILKQANGSAMKLVELVSSEFPCFYDVAEYEGEKVAIFKRVQILASDIWMLYRGQGLGDFKDIDQITMFADYRVPQALAYFGALEYSDSLNEKLMKEHMFKTGDREEVEIRGCSIHGVELIVKEIKRVMSERGMSSAGINSGKVDYFLWDYRINNAKELEKIPYHRVRCIFY